MGKPILLLRLEGPLQSWGVRARWGVRDTTHEPTKSGIMGLLGCALGYPMYDPRIEHELDKGLFFGVRVENAGHIAEDFHTITGVLPTAQGKAKGSGIEFSTILSPRFYLEDAAFLVALEETGEVSGVLRCCAEAVQQPVWPLYLGRKACVPTRPVFQEFTEAYADLADALARCPWSWLGCGMAERCIQPPQRTLAYIEDPDGPLVRQDAIRTNTARVYGFRQARAMEVVFLGGDT